MTKDTIFPYLYTVKYIEGDLRTTECGGFVMANTFADAAAQIETMFQEDLISITELTPLDECALSFLPVEAVRHIQGIIESYE